MNEPNPIVSNTPLFAAIFQQNWENARHIKSERIWFMNTYAVISAGVLSLLRSIHGESILEIALMVFMFIFSIIGLLTSFRLKAELEECLARIQAMVMQAHAEEFVALGQSGGHLAHYPKFRWIFPVFYSIATLSFGLLLIYRLLHHS